MISSQIVINLQFKFINPEFENVIDSHCSKSEWHHPQSSENVLGFLQLSKNPNSQLQFAVQSLTTKFLGGVMTKGHQLPLPYSVSLCVCVIVYVT